MAHLQLEAMVYDVSSYHVVATLRLAPTLNLLNATASDNANWSAGERLEQRCFEMPKLSQGRCRMRQGLSACCSNFMLTELSQLRDKMPVPDLLQKCQWY